MENASGWNFAPDLVTQVDAHALFLALACVWAFYLPHRLLMQNVHRIFEIWLKNFF